MSWAEIKKAVNSNIDVPLNNLLPFSNVINSSTITSYVNGGANYPATNVKINKRTMADIQGAGVFSSINLSAAIGTEDGVSTSITRQLYRGFKSFAFNVIIDGTTRIVWTLENSTLTNKKIDRYISCYPPQNSVFADASGNIRYACIYDGNVTVYPKGSTGSHDRGSYIGKTFIEALANGTDLGGENFFCMDRYFNKSLKITFEGELKDATNHPLTQYYTNDTLAMARIKYTLF